MADPFHLNANGSIRPFTEGEFASMAIFSRGVRDGSNPTHTRAVDSNTARMTFFCNFEQFEFFNAYMLGAQVKYSDSGTWRISRLPPQSFPGKERMLCVQLLSATGHQFYEDDPDYDAIPSPTYYKMACEYQFEHTPFAATPDDETPNETVRYVQDMPSQTDVQFLTMPGGSLRFIRTGGSRPHLVPIPHSFGFPEATSVITKKWHRLPFDAWGPGKELFNRIFGDPDTGELPYIATVNSNRFLGYPPGVLLYLGVEEEKLRDPLAERDCWTLTHKWLLKSAQGTSSSAVGHNAFYYFETDPAAAANSGYYFTCKTPNTTAYSPDLLPDHVSLFNSRNHMGLFQVG